MSVDFHRYLAWILVCCCAMVTAPLAADMMVSPTRILLDDKHRTATLVLRNSGAGPRSYRLSWEDKRMREQDGYVAIKEGESWPSASNMVRHSPRQITVGPGENQTVRLSWRPPADLPPGEYRSHLLLQVIPDISEPSAVLQGNVGEDGIGIRLFMQMSFSLPVVVRHQVPAPQVKLAKVAVEAADNSGQKTLAVTLERSGEASSFGSLIVEMQRDANSPVEIIGQQHELSVFHELDRRIVRVPLRDVVIPAGAWIRVAYEGRQEYQGMLWAEQIFRSE